MDAAIASSPPVSPRPPRSAIQRPSSTYNARAKRSSRHMSEALFGRSPEDEEAGRTAVKVAVRVRPPLRPSDPGFDLIPQRFRDSTCDVPTPSSLSIQSPQGKKLFVFDRVFEENVAQEGIWEYLSESVASFVQGYNVSILAYGQSGSGKSYTMGTSGPTEQNDPEIMGVVPRAARTLFNQLQGSAGNRFSSLQMPKRYSVQALPTPDKSTNDDKNWTLKATYVEIYNEQLRDLLISPNTPDSDRPQVAIREDTKGRILLTGLQQVEVNSVEDLLNALNFGSSIRQTDATAINARSSRSHAVFSLQLVQKKSDGMPTSPTPKAAKRRSMPIDALSPTPENSVTIDSKLHFVDLAGSERLKNTGATGDRAKEGISINAGLASLGKVISQLSSKSGTSHVSYRDSRLTRLLQDSLGGSAITFMVACVTPAVFHLSETLNTVHYAQRARAIQSKPEIQQTHDDVDKQAAIEKLRAEVSFLRDQIRHSERGDRRSMMPTEHVVERNKSKEADLQTQLMDMQENYSALSQRHAKLISEISKARDTGEDTPMLKEAIGENAMDRLKRSNSFAEAVEQVVLEYEKTIQNLESSLSKTRGTLSHSESTLLEKETRIQYMETIQQQLQARLQKALDREQNNESYVHDLEARIEGTTTGEENNAALIMELRKELQHVRESENSAEDYISTLEERLAEAEQDQEIMQREIERLEHVVERQRSIGRLDNLLTELDGNRQPAVPPVPPLPREFQDSDVDGGKEASTTNGHPAEGEDDDEYDPFRPRSPTRKASASAPPRARKSVIELSRSRAASRSRSRAASRANLQPPAYPMEPMPRSPAQDDFMADKLESLTQELFDLRGEHETNLNAYDTLQQKYETALRTLAQMEYEKSNGTPEEKDVKSSQVQRGRPPSAFLAEDESSEQRPSSRSLSEELSSQEQHTTGIEKVSENLADSERADDEATRGVAGEKTANESELANKYEDLVEQHHASLQQVEELKAELQRAQSFRPTSPSMGKGMFRRRSDDVLGAAVGADRASKSFTSLKTIALANFEQNPDTRQSFDSHLTNVMAELNSRSERVAALEAELANFKKEMDNKQQLITGLTRERSSLKAASGVDFSVIGQMREQLEQSENTVRTLHESHAVREKELQEQVEELKQALDSRHKASGSRQLPTPDNEHFSNMPGQFHEPPAREVSDKQATGGAEDVAHLQRELAAWEQKHNSVVDSMKASEAKLLKTISALQEELREAEYPSPQGSPTPGGESRSLEGAAALASLETERARHRDVVDALQREANEYKETADRHVSKLAQLEESYSKIQQQVEEDSKSRDLSEKELKTHQDLVANLENQLQVHKSAIEIHQESLESLQASHSKELEGLNAAMYAAEKESVNRHTTMEARYKKTTSDLQKQLTHTQKENAEMLRSAAGALGYGTAPSQLGSHIQGLVDEGKELHSRHLKTSNELKKVQEELRVANDKIADLEGKIGELKMLNDESLLNLQKITEKERKSSRLVEELEDQLNNQFDTHQAASNRLSRMATEKEKAHADIMRELEEQRSLNQLLTQQIQAAKRQSLASESNRGSVNFNRESLSPEAAAIALARSPSTSSNVRKSGPPSALPTPPPSIPLPPLPGTPEIRAASPVQQQHSQTASPPGSRHTSKDVGHGMSQLVEEQDARIRTIEKHLFAEKQLTATLEEALVDLETSANRTKTEMDTWRKKCGSLEDELVSLRKEKSNSRASLQAVEEEREMRVRAEKARQALEQRMMELNASKKKKKNALNCF